MRMLLATLRRQPAPLVGTLVALTVAALLVTILATMVGTAITMTVPAGRLAGASVVVTGGPDQTVIGAGLARAARLRPGDQVRLAGAAQPPYTVVGVASSGRNPAQNLALFWSAAQAGIRYGHPSGADLIGLIARPGTSAQ